MATVQQELDKLGKKIVKDAIAYPIPVDTGALKKSLTYEFSFTNNDKFSLIFSQMFYGKYVDQGTSKMKARPYFSDAISKNVDKKGLEPIIRLQVEDIMESVLKNKTR